MTRPVFQRLEGIKGATHAEREGLYEAARMMLRTRSVQCTTEMEGVSVCFADPIRWQPEVGGYLSWFNPETDTLQQLQYFSGEPTIRDLGPATANLSLRECIDKQTQPLRLSHMRPDKDVTLRREALVKATAARARLYDAAERSLR